MDNKIAVIYKSKYGSTKKYAGWIALRLDADLYEVSDIRNKDLKEYDTIIYGGGIYYSKINGISFIEKNFHNIKNKRVIIFTVGMESISEELRKKIIDKNLSDEMLSNISLVNFRGSIFYNELSRKDKLLMKGLKIYIDKKDFRDLTEDDKLILDSFNKQIDMCDKKSIDKLIELL